MPSHETSMQNLAKAKANWRQPRPWRSSNESRMVRRFVFQWFTCRGTRPSGRAWARQLGVSHSWVKKLIREFQADPSKMYRGQRISGDPNFAQLSRAREHTQRMRERGELRPSGRAKLIEA
jgi:transposase